MQPKGGGANFARSPFTDVQTLSNPSIVVVLSSSGCRTYRSAVRFPSGKGTCMVATVWFMLARHLVR